MKDLKILVKNLPNKPGVYLMKNAQGETLYVGKAISLKNRVGSYFKSDKGLLPHTKRLVSEIRDLETIITDSEEEALILENNLIKRYQPKFNIQFKDGKSYPFVKITKHEKYPRIMITRKLIHDGSIYFGPYTDVWSLRRTIHYIRKYFQIANCKNNITSKISRPCIEYQIKKCSAPCTEYVSTREYNELVDAVIRILEGSHKSLSDHLVNNIEKASQNKEFEKADAYHNQLKMVNKIVQKQKIISFGGGNQDYIAIACFKQKATAQVFLVREGILLDRKQFILQIIPGIAENEIISAFLTQYYADAKHIPDEIILSSVPSDSENIQKWLSVKGKIRLKKATSKKEKDLLNMVYQNATLFLDQKMGTTKMKKESQLQSIKELQQFLKMKNSPQHIDGFDISNISGFFAVGSMVVFKNAEPVNSEYRKFKIKTVKGADDYSMMKEIILRRYTRIQNEKSSLPDLVLVDGGKGHLRIAKSTLKSLGLQNLPVIALAKGFEEIYTTKSIFPLVLPRGSKALLLVQHIRDEAHRFAIQYHKVLRKKGLTLSILDEIPGVGPVKKKILLKHFGDVQKIEKASLEKIKNIQRISPKLALTIYNFLNKSESIL